MATSTLPILLLILLVVSRRHIQPATGAGGNETDRLSLLQLKSTLVDPLGALSSWNQSLHFCQWQGVTCNNEEEERVTQVDLKLSQLSGSISPHIGNLTFLTHLILNNNSISGEIPPEIGRLQRLEVLVLFQNSISGSIPPNLSACSNLTRLGVAFNSLAGEVPLQLCNLINLQLLSIPFNNLSGNFPSCFGNASSLQTISAARNEFVGGIPESLARLRDLGLISFGANRFSGSFPLQFFNSSSIHTISIIENQLTGILPPDIGFTLPNLVHLNVAYNNFSGRIPGSISNATNLQAFELGHNYFHGGVPSLSKLNKIQFLGLMNNSLGSGGNNSLSGSIPSNIGNSTKLLGVWLQGNQLEGEIPASFGKCKDMTVLYLADNNLSGEIPPEILNLPDLSRVLDLSRNRLSGRIPECVRLENLNLMGNLFQGSIPSSLRTLKGLALLDLSRNNLSGKIPDFLQDFSSLLMLNLSYNHFQGALSMQGVFRNSTTTLIAGNKELCGGMPEFGLPKCLTERSKKGGLNTIVKIIISTVSCFLGLTVLVSFLYYCLLRKNIKDPEAPSPFTGYTLLGPTYHNLLQGTDGFSPANLLGVGSYGSVYKGLIAIDDANKIFVAVKVLNLHHYRAFKSFVAECEVLKNIRHKNLVKLLTVALVYEFMVSGSLEEWLHPGLLDEQATERRAELSLLQRLNIAIDVGIALDYLHNESGVPVVHCDLKPSNILLDVNMVGHIGDFGLAKFLPQVELNAPTNHTTNSSSIAVRGTVGYSAPEYGMGSEVSTNGDVYSYGILLLEMFTGRRPTDETFRDGLNLHNFAAALGDNAADYIDPRQDDNSSRSRTNEKQVFAEAVVSIVQVGVECSNEIARERMGISDAVTKLTAVRDKIVKRRN
ncbi:unnamed protein product [Linum tenue]|uniref:non-specific serine/threonine protein kinase n=1 Tax=Linum tenue TaxID=586396 RepID=A0AAV0MC26_9ROSI|nr:unnamed protein product [Linum tenue]